MASPLVKLTRWFRKGLSKQSDDPEKYRRRNFPFKLRKLLPQSSECFFSKMQFFRGRAIFSDNGLGSMGDGWEFGGRAMCVWASRIWFRPRLHLQFICSNQGNTFIKYYFLCLIFTRLGLTKNYNILEFLKMGFKLKPLFKNSSTCFGGSTFMS